MNLIIENENWLIEDGIREIWNLFCVFLNKDFSKELICVFN